MRWAKRSRDAFDEAFDDASDDSSDEKGTGLLNPGAQLFGIIQGGMYDDLRRASLSALQEVGFDGYAIGGLSVGESKEDMDAVMTGLLPHMPEDKPRYLMGVGTPADLVRGVALGVDMFDCVMPTRNGRNHRILPLAAH